MELARTESCANILKVSVHSKPNFRKYAVFSALAVLYALVLPWIWSTMGQPLERAIEEAREMDAKTAIQDFDDFDVVEIDIGGDTEPIEAEESNSTAEYERPLPSPYLSDAGAMFSLFILVFVHSLFFLLCHWLVWFDIRAFYTPASTVTAGKFLHVVPFPHRGKSAICLVQRSSHSGKLEFTFQKQKFELNLPTERESAELTEVFQLMNGAKKQTLTKEEAETKEVEAIEIARTVGFILPLSPVIHQTLGFFKKSRGFRNEEEIEKAAVRYGLNDLRADPPRLSNILFQQLLSPLAIFQLFSASLWFLDSYWQQAIFSFVMIILMEFTTSFQRHRTAKMLRNLAPKPFQVLVCRGGSWMVILSDKLLPGDLISLGSNANGNQGSVVPCDCLILNGSAVVNEATLTGESVPQMKDSILGNDSKETLDVVGKHRLHVLFSGTSLISTTPGEQRKTPNNGCLCYVLRTGFGSSQGELMQMIEFSTESVSDTKETGYALLILLVFALISSAYVFKIGLEKGKRTTHELLLRCVIIITQVVPQHLPVQMAAAVNYALIALNRKGILCTEPFRLPSGGKITHCFFDKTGTLTSDELVPVGIVNRAELETDKTGLDMLQPVHKADTETAMVLSSCHSLISLPNEKKEDMPKLLGDPIEIAAVKGVQWTYYPSSETSKPGLDERMIAKLKENAKSEDVAAMTKLATGISRDSAISEIKILNRYHFSSQLQRMSVIARVKFKKEGNKLACLVKGSPEAIKTLLKPESVPERYEEVYQQMAEKGMRVLALGYKFVSSGSGSFSASNLHQTSRETVEEKLDFAGFVAFECKIRGDTKATIQALNHSDHKVTMVTGDALLTALHVAKECSICLKPKALLLREKEGKLFWQVATSSSSDTTSIPFNASIDGCDLTRLSEEYDLLLTEKMLQQAVSASNLKIWSEIDAVKVFARMSPPGKAEIIRYIQDKGNSEKLVFMCGDGGNDVGALKQADVGLALLSGFGSSNTQNVATEGEDESTLNELDKLEAIKTRKATKAKKKEASAIRKAIMKKQPDLVKAEVARRVANGEAQSISLQFSVAKQVTFQLQKEIKVEMQKLNAKYSIHKNKVTKNAEELSIFDKFKVAMEEQQNGGDASESLGLEDGQVPIVRPGDASVAAPFTSRVPSIRSVVHLIRQGRCTLLSALQQQQTMMLECTISAYTMAALSLEGSRQSERQLLASSWLILTAVGSFSYSSPLETMHPVKPLKSLFHPAIILSIALQAVIHLWCISYGVKIAKAAMGDELLQEVIDFNYAAAKGLDRKLEELEDEYDPIAGFMAMWEHPFKPNLLNTVVFLIQTAQTMAVYFVNYKGRPWMNGLLENHALFLSLFVAIGSVAVAAWEMLPFLNNILQLEPFPDDAFRVQVLILVILSIFGTFVVDRVVTGIFAPEVFRAMWESARETTMKDIMPIASSLAKGVVLLLVVGSSNPIIWIGAFWLYRKRKTYLEKQEEEELDSLEKRLLNKQ